MTFRFSDREVAFRPALLGPGLLFGLGLLFYGFEETPRCESIGHSLLTDVFVGFLACCPVLLALCRALERHPLLARVLGCALTLAGSLLIALGLAIPDAPKLGPLAGACLAYVCASWLLAYAAAGPWSSLLHTALALCLAGIVYIVGSGLPEERATAYELLLAAGATSCLAFAAPRSNGEAVEARDAQDVRSVGLAFARSQWVPLIGVALVAFVFGHRWSSAAEGLGVGKQGLLGGYEYLLGPLVAFFAAWVLLNRVHGGAPQRAACRVLIPVAAALMLVIPVINPIRGFYRVIDPSQPWCVALGSVLDILNESAVSLLLLSALVSLASAPRTTGMPPIAAGALLAASCAAGALLGMGSYSLVGADGTIVCFLAWTVYLLCVGLAELSSSKGERIVHETVEASIARASDSISRRCGLTEREKEVLRHLARGHTYAHIAQEMFISENTVRTHAKHIYAKVGVDGREGLFSLVDEALSPDGGMSLPATRD